VGDINNYRLLESRIQGPLERSQIWVLSSKI
jgi:hypothetical protein